MFKKITAVVVCALCATVVFTGCSKKAAEAPKKAAAKTAAVAEKKQTKEDAVRAFVTAVYVNQDADAVYALLSPELKRDAISKMGDEAKVKEALVKKFWGKATPEQLAQMKEYFNNKENMDKAVKQMLEVQGNKFVEVEGKWYINSL
jgi:dsRNA-specific ribonuclease